MNLSVIPEILDPGQLATQPLQSRLESVIVPKEIPDSIIVCIDDNIMNLYAIKLML